MGLRWCTASKLSKGLGLCWSRTGWETHLFRAGLDPRLISINIVPWLMSQFEIGQVPIMVLHNNSKFLNCCLIIVIVVLYQEWILDKEGGIYPKLVGMDKWRNLNSVLTISGQKFKLRLPACYSIPPVPFFVRKNNSLSSRLLFFDKDIQPRKDTFTSLTKRLVVSFMNRAQSRLGGPITLGVTTLKVWYPLSPNDEFPFICPCCGERDDGWETEVSPSHRDGWTSCFTTITPFPPTCFFFPAKSGFEAQKPRLSQELRNIILDDPLKVPRLQF